MLHLNLEGGKSTCLHVWNKFLSLAASKPSTAASHPKARFCPVVSPNTLLPAPMYVAAAQTGTDWACCLQQSLQFFYLHLASPCQLPMQSCTHLRANFLGQHRVCAVIQNTFPVFFLSPFILCPPASFSYCFAAPHLQKQTSASCSWWDPT